MAAAVVGSSPLATIAAVICCSVTPCFMRMAPSTASIALWKSLCSSSTASSRLWRTRTKVGLPCRSAAIMGSRGPLRTGLTMRAGERKSGKGCA